MDGDSISEEADFERTVLDNERVFRMKILDEEVKKVEPPHDLKFLRPIIK